ncbi:30S ribosomal protein S2 [Maribacter sp. PR1]|uniref:Small ribosomal subunit protein uS2 n=1 Tax=Maribacter cobaltidurans TaxID=1178778 RepID=A0ABU7IPK9_9FLAO|nr:MULTISPECIES: 30S ribosomal protein S2 [Maribacter]MDC6387371.1 30S ribosomal protein S2 [Maribacter sp. PR1]MEE1974756.1 30S ribosomal protein S2 [Maribacter cobaltidurans]
MAKVEVKQLLEAGVHFGHLTRKWNPNMAPYIYMERNGIHVINLYKTVAKMDEANEALSKIAASGRKILFVATKKQAKDIVAEKASNVNMPYITERWPGGMLTNFVTIRKAVKKMASIDRMKKDGTFNTLSKKERLQVDRLRAKLEKNLGSISEMTRLPGALFIVDTMREHIAVKEAQKLNIPIFAMVDTNSDPRDVDYLIPSNDDASKSIDIIMTQVTDAVAEGLAERKSEKSEATEGKKEKAPKKKETLDKPEPTPAKVDTKPTPVVDKVPNVTVDVEATKEAVKEDKKADSADSDDLTKIEGVGPKAAEALSNGGLNTFAKVAKADADKMKEILTEASSRMAHLDPTSWPKQAKMAADGKWDELKEWQDSVKGGVE